MHVLTGPFASLGEDPSGIRRGSFAARSPDYSAAAEVLTAHLAAHGSPKAAAGGAPSVREVSLFLRELTFIVARLFRHVHTPCPRYHFFA